MKLCKPSYVLKKECVKMGATFGARILATTKTGGKTVLGILPFHDLPVTAKTRIQGKKRVWLFSPSCSVFVQTIIHSEKGCLKMGVLFCAGISWDAVFARSLSLTQYSVRTRKQCFFLFSKYEGVNAWSDVLLFLKTQKHGALLYLVFFGVLKMLESEDVWSVDLGTKIQPWNHEIAPFSYTLDPVFGLFLRNEQVIISS